MFACQSLFPLHPAPTKRAPSVGVIKQRATGARSPALLYVLRFPDPGFGGTGNRPGGVAKLNQKRGLFLGAVKDAVAGA